MGAIKRHQVLLGLFCAISTAQLAALRSAEPAPVETRKPWVPELEVEKYTLRNGLTVILHEDHRIPLVAVNVTYNVGSKDDPPGRTGIAHLFEHMMFEGSEHNEGSYDWPIYPFVDERRAWTDYDRTVYYATVTRDALERVLWLEADRMGFLLPALNEAKLSKARGVVKSERWQTVEMVPLGEIDEVANETIFPPGHPYRHPVIGSTPHLSAAGLDDVLKFFRRHYAPNNAFLCLAGDFEPALARHWIQKYFGGLPRGDLAASPAPAITTLDTPRRITLTDGVSHARAKLFWPTVPANHPDEAALDVLASVLGGASKWNRLFRALLYDRQIAAMVSASHPTHVLAGNFVVELEARSGHKLDELVRLADAEIERLKREGPTAHEVRRVKIERRTSLITQLESLTSKATVFNNSAATLADPLAYRSVLAKIFTVTPEEVKRVAREYLGARRIELDVMPGARMARPDDREIALAEPDQQADVERAPIDLDLDRSVVPEAGPPPRFTPPVIVRDRLSCGLELRIVERHELPDVTFKLVVKSGETSTPRGKEGLTSLAVNLLGEATKSRSSLQLEADLADIGASLSTASYPESSEVSLTTVTRHLERALDLYADVILRPSFSEQDLHRLKLERLSTLESRADDPALIAEDVFPRLLYSPEHPYARPRWGTLESVQSITREDVAGFYRGTFVPGNAVLVVVGDIRPDAIAAALESRFESWPPGPIPRAPLLPQTPWPAVNETIYLIDKPGAAQSVVSIGRIGAAVKSPDRYTLRVLFDKLGDRINENLQSDKASTYQFTSSFYPRKTAGPFAVAGSVHKIDTKEAIVEVFKEMTDLAGPRLIAKEVLAQSQDAMIPVWFSRFETTERVASEVAYLVARELPDDSLAMELQKHTAVTKRAVDRAARRYLTPERMTILVVGDRSWIEASLRSLPFVKTIRLLGTDGNPLPGPPAREPAPAEETAHQ